MTKLISRQRVSRANVWTETERERERLCMCVWHRQGQTTDSQHSWHGYCECGMMAHIRCVRLHILSITFDCLNILKIWWECEICLRFESFIHSVQSFCHSLLRKMRISVVLLLLVFAVFCFLPVYPLPFIRIAMMSDERWAMNKRAHNIHTVKVKMILHTVAHI